MPNINDDYIIKEVARLSFDDTIERSDTLFNGYMNYRGAIIDIVIDIDVDDMLFLASGHFDKSDMIPTRIDTLRDYCEALNDFLAEFNLAPLAPGYDATDMEILTFANNLCDDARRAAQSH